MLPRNTAGRGFGVLPLLFSLICACQSPSHPPTKQLDQWPRAQPPWTRDAQTEDRIDRLLATLSLEQKVAQMIQADIASVSPETMSEFVLGSILSGGGQQPREKANAALGDWVTLADELHRASMNPDPGQTAIPVMWGVDAVHGHGNLVGATLYPHNIALGATRNPELVGAIAAATAREVAATGLDWNFAPTVAVARDLRWGRTYESFSENPSLVAELAAPVVIGLQGRPGTDAFLDQHHILAGAKHFIGDGGTAQGDDRGHTLGSEQTLIDTHLPGYISALDAGVQTVMASYSWWRGEHSHTNSYLLKEVLKGRLGFDGLVVSDWQAIGIPRGCTTDSCAAAVNAGIDLFMIPKAPDWQRFHANTTAQVRDGTIPMARIDDAVRRILRVKMRLKLWRKPKPSQRALAGHRDIVGSAQHRQLARQAVRESLVLLKNNGTLPLDPTQTLLITGSGANNLAMQAGGWSVTWQGRESTNDQYPGATSIYSGLQQAVEAAGGRALLSPDGEIPAEVDAAIVVTGELPYAEMHGDIENLGTLEFQQHDKRALQLIERLQAEDIPVVVVLLSGRPLWVNKELNAADAFVAAWQPGTEGAGVADVLLASEKGAIRHDFTGRLGYSWPAHPCQARVNVGDTPYEPLFAYGYGLSYRQPGQAWETLKESTQAWRYGCLLGADKPEAQARLLNRENGWQYFAELQTFVRRPVEQAVTLGSLQAEPLETPRFGVRATWRGGEQTRLTMRNGNYENQFLDLLANDGALVMDIKVHRTPSDKVYLSIMSESLTRGDLDITAPITALPMNSWQSIAIDMQCMANSNADFSKISSPMGLHTNGPWGVSIAKVRFEPNRAHSAELQCQAQ